MKQGGRKEGASTGHSRLLMHIRRVPWGEEYGVWAWMHHLMCGGLRAKPCFTVRQLRATVLLRLAGSVAVSAVGFHLSRLQSCHLDTLRQRIKVRSWQGHKDTGSV